jgi:Ca2+-binding EF-hand superfamily protein
MKTVLFSAAVAVAAVSPALAQAAPAPQHQMHMQPMTRAAMVQKVQEHFAKVDSNRDGFVTRTEMDAAHEQMRSKILARVEKRLGDHGIELPDRAAMFDRLDANRDGSISREEFTSAKPLVKERRVIVMKDGSETGQNGAGPMRIRMHAMGMGMGGHMFEMADSDKDGRVSIQEATNAAAAHFDKADANHDGTLSRDEMRAAHKAMRGKTGG